ncbi:MAG: hypothetical protein ABIA37_01330 [Candidatus Woesearchaeota archaeon]
MGWLRRAFAKKEEDKDKMLHFDEPLPEDTGLEEKPVFPEMSSMSHPSPELPPHLEEPFSGIKAAPADKQRELELINSKLDMLKSILNSIDQRIANLERAAGVPQKKMPW